MDGPKLHRCVALDPMYYFLARKSMQPVASVFAVANTLLKYASDAEDRGSIAGFDYETIDVALELPVGATQAIVDAMTWIGIIADGRIASFKEESRNAMD